MAEGECLVRVEGQRMGSGPIAVIDRGPPGVGAGVGERAEAAYRRAGSMLTPAPALTLGATFSTLIVVV